MSRQTVVVIVAAVEGRDAIHFTSTKLQGDNLWFPFSGIGVFDSVENIMVLNRVAHNVVSCETLRDTSPDSRDYLITYNEPEDTP